MTLLPYAANSPAWWSSVSCATRSDGRIDVTYTRPQGNSATSMVAQSTTDQAGSGTVTYDSPFGSSGAFGAVTYAFPTWGGFSTSNPLAFLRIFVKGPGAGWPVGTSNLTMAVTPIGSLPSGIHEVLIYGAWSAGPAALPTVTFTARPSAAARLDKRIALDGGAL